MLDNLPTELILRIYLYLPTFSDVAHLQLVSCRLRDIWVVHTPSISRSLLQHGRTAGIELPEVSNASYRHVYHKASMNLLVNVLLRRDRFPGSEKAPIKCREAVRIHNVVKRVSCTIRLLEHKFQQMIVQKLASSQLPSAIPTAKVAAINFALANTSVRNTITDQQKDMLSKALLDIWYLAELDSTACNARLRTLSTQCRGNYRLLCTLAQYIHEHEIETRDGTTIRTWWTKTAIRPPVTEHDATEHSEVDILRRLGEYDCNFECDGWQCSSRRTAKSNNRGYVARPGVW